MKFYEKTWFIVLMLLFIPPVGLYLIWKTKNWNNVVKIIVTVPFAFWSLILIGAIFSPEPSASVSVKPIDTTSKELPSSSTEPSTPVPSTPVSSTVPSIQTSPTPIIRPTGIIPLELDVNFSMSEGKIIVFMTSNLPQNTKLMVQLHNSKIGYNASSNLILDNNGSFTSDTFSYKGNALPPGEYDITISAPLSSIQPEDVQVIIGDDYKNYESNYITDGGATSLGKFIQYKNVITIEDNSTKLKIDEGFVEDYSQLDSATEKLKGDIAKENLCDLLKIVLPNQLAKGEQINDITLEGDNLFISVDLSSTNPAPFTYQDLAESRTSSITDEILRYDNLDKFWKTITLKFSPNIGSVHLKISDVEQNEYARYFKSSSFTFTND